MLFPFIGPVWGQPALGSNLSHRGHGVLQHRGPARRGEATDAGDGRNRGEPRGPVAVSGKSEKIIRSG